MTTKTYAGVTHTVVERQGFWLDVRTAAFFDSVNKAMPGGVTIVQGPFSKSVDASAGTHDGPGALDLKPAAQKYKNVAGYEQLETICRRRGGASWFREWTNNFHVHVIVIGTKGLPTVAAKQVTAYLNARDGLVSNKRITGVIKTTWEKFKAAVTADNGMPRGAFPYPNGKASAYGVSTPGKPYYSGKVGGYITKSAIQGAIKRIQRRVKVTPDGLFGAQTKAAVVAYQRKYKLTPDGVVGPVTWTKMTKSP